MTTTDGDEAARVRGATARDEGTVRYAGARWIAGVLLSGVCLVATAAAAGTPIDVGGAVIDCSTVSGTLSFSPSLVMGGTATTSTLLVRGTLDGCVMAGPGAVATIGPSKFVGRLTGGTNDCTVLGDPIPFAGDLVIRWKADPATPLLQTTSTVAVTTLGVTAFHPASIDNGFGTALFPDFALGVGGVTGAFTGGDGGAGARIRFVTTQAAPTFLGRCNGAGVRSLSIGIGRVSLH
jgi:hypothetical protein